MWAQCCELEKTAIISRLLKNRAAAAVWRKAARLQSESGRDGEGPGERIVPVWMSVMAPERKRSGQILEVLRR